ncbi:DUF3344 domain-containing protein [Methanofollis aquaemaris]|uniref:DUF3344 domain-containing protein n=1 Tax=Methanofollis aquaemaris TaxID=126734 RepID=A0A8A3S774_9EURY|nr:DUF3344 domain-containing protein [Methanofollis aquaemaris]QSZ67985.1 DUF3344 domain-containing protein [Methanofollis aquaemaris]
MKLPQFSLIGCILCAAVLLLAAPVSAVYDFEGIPLHMTAQGEVRGDVLTFGTYGLAAPPMECTFSLPDKPIWARVYTGVWGGTERYTGWEELTVNNGVPVKRSLFGIDDRNKETYVSGYGVYWVAHDCTDQLHGGKNTVALTTSRGLPESRIDGRVYGVFVVAVVEDKDGPVTRYWIAEGNENLHGEGWAGTNPTRHNDCEISFEKASLLEGATADFTMLLLASTKGQPDYIRFNGEDLGVAPDDPSIYPDGARDIGNERCFDATGGAGTEARYIDVEKFDVSGLLKETNHIFFERGRDLDDDGTITTTGEKPEGEDYIHPCCAILAVRRPGADPAPDFSVDAPQVRGAYAGEEAVVQATARNHGARPEGMITVIFSVDGVPAETVTVEPDVSGVQEVTANLTMDEGRHTLSARVETGGDLDLSDNEASVSVRVGTIPDLAVKIGTPVRTGAGEPDAQHSPFPLIALVGGICAAALLARRPPGGKLVAVLIAGAVIAASCPLVIFPAAAAGYEDYTIPVTITNNGGSDAPPFALTVYLDGEKAAVKPIEEGLEAGATVEIALSHYTTPGKHRLRVVADEAGTIRDAERGNNAAEGDYVFP